MTRRFPTAIEDIVLTLIFEYMGESRINRTWDEYQRIASELPPLKVLHYEVNRRLKNFERSGEAPYEICRFRAGDKVIKYEPYPTSVSMETIRSALNVSGMRHPRKSRKSLTCRNTVAPSPAV